MGFDVSWDTEDRSILIWNQQGDFSVKEFREAYQLSHTMVADIEGMYHLVIAGTGGKMPVFPFSEMHYAFKNASPKLDLTIFVVTDPFMRSMIGMLRKMPMPVVKRIIYANSLEHARVLVAERRRELRPQA